MAQQEGSPPEGQALPAEGQALPPVEGQVCLYLSFKRKDFDATVVFFPLSTKEADNLGKKVRFLWHGGGKVEMTVIQQPL